LIFGTGKMDTLHSTVLCRVSNKPAAVIAVFFSIGIAFSLLCHDYSFGGLAVAGLLLICAAFQSLRRKRLALSLALGLSTIVLCGLLIALAHRDGFSDSDVRFLLARGLFPLNEPVSFEGCVDTDSENRGTESLCTIALHAFLKKDRWIVASGKGMLLSAEPDRESPSAPPIILKRGDRVRGWASWHMPYNFENPGSPDRAGILARRGIYLVGRVKSSRLLEIIPGDCSNPISQLAASVRARVRASLVPIKDKENGQPAAILASLVIGDYAGLNNATREIFQNSGTFHVLVVSGLHVAWIAGVLLQLFKLFRFPEKIRHPAAAGAIFVYTCIIGFQASISRCLWMFILYLIGRMLFRRADALNILAASALILLAVEPVWLFETGFQLSFLSVTAIATTAAPIINSYLKPAMEPLRHTGDPKRLFVQPGPWQRRGRTLRVRCEMMIEEATDSLPAAVSRAFHVLFRGIASLGLVAGSAIAVSLSVQIWLEPLLAFSFNRMSWISPLANLIIVPFSSAVLAAGIIASSTAHLPLCGPALIRLAGSLASLLLSAARFVTKVPGAWQRCPTPSAAWIVGGILLLFVWTYFEWRRFYIPCIYIAAVLACLSCGTVPVMGSIIGKCRTAVHNKDKETWPKHASILRFSFLDVGEGDSIVIRFPDGRLWLLDAGGLRMPPSREENANAFDIGEAVVSRFLWHEWITGFERVVMSHTDIDHSGGIPAIMKNFRIAKLDYSASGANGAILNSVLSIARDKGMQSHCLQAGMEEAIGGVTVRTVNPRADAKPGSANEGSLVLQISYNRFSALLTGDLEKTGELELLSQPLNLGGQLLKAAHHGSRNGTSNGFLDRMHPRWAIVSAGRNNPFGHPSHEVLARLLNHGIRPILTLNEGAITFETDGERYVVKTHVSGLLEHGELEN
jgi:competence protein ComEC